MSEFEKRIAQQVELRADESGTKTLTGYAAVFNSPTDIGGYFTEQIAPGADRQMADEETGYAVTALAPAR